MHIRRTEHGYERDALKENQNRFLIAAQKYQSYKSKKGDYKL